MKTKENKGITLIALVITIIVLLILTGVTIATLTGENGILTRATDAKEQTEIASVREQAQLDITNWVADKMENGEDVIVNTPEKIQEILESVNQNNENKYYKGFTDTGITTPNGYEVPYEELYITSSSGEETASKTIEDLVAGDIVYYDTGNTSVGNEGIIECFGVSEDSNKVSAVGGIIGWISKTGTSGTIENNYNNGKVTGKTSIGGIIGRSANTFTITKCYSKGEVEGESQIGAAIGVQEGSTDNLSSLYYLNTIGVKGINGKDVADKVMGVEDDINSYEEFIGWIENK